MGPEAWFTVGTITLVILALISNRISVDVAMIGGLTLLMVGDFFFGYLRDQYVFSDFSRAISGFAHPALLMIASLFVVAAGLQETGGMEAVAQKLLGRPRSVAMAQVRLMAPVALMSGFMNNTPIVAMYLPIVNNWARKLRLSPSKLFMPLSFGAILGGKLTLIGSASNIVVMGLYLSYWRVPANTSWIEQLGVREMSETMQFWGIAAIGIPCTVAGLVLIVIASKWLLPERRPADAIGIDARRYQVEMLVKDDSPIVGKSIEEAGLRHLPGLYLVQIERDGTVLPAVSPDEKLKANDRLAFVGILESVVDLRKIRGLDPATDQVLKVAAAQPLRTLVEAVVSRNSPLVGQTVRTSRFRTIYNAAIIAVYRDGQSIHSKIGDITLQPGDTLLLDTHTGFVSAYRNSTDFYLVSTVEGSRPIRYERAWLSLAILGALVFMLTVVPIQPVAAAMLCAMAMVVTRCVSGTVARGAVNWQVLIVIASALGMGSALEDSGAAAAITVALRALCDGAGIASHPHAMLLVMFLLAAGFSQLITNNGAAVLMFPIVMATAKQLEVNPEPFVLSLMVAAGSSFMSPVAYQTNLMVYGPGGYRFMDYVRLGLPLTLLVAILSTFFAPLFFPFHP
ncbi:MAG: SLC13 family permease [Planctomycetes bacterium]|nr:SLC13 family permease [Planctomycetota bacterium]